MIETIHNQTRFITIQLQQSCALCGKAQRNASHIIIQFILIAVHTVALESLVARLVTLAGLATLAPRL